MNWRKWNLTFARCIMNIEQLLKVNAKLSMLRWNWSVFCTIPRLTSAPFRATLFFRITLFLANFIWIWLYIVVSFTYINLFLCDCCSIAFSLRCVLRTSCEIAKKTHTHISKRMFMSKIIARKKCIRNILLSHSQWFRSHVKGTSKISLLHFGSNGIF